MLNFIKNFIYDVMEMLINIKEIFTPPIDFEMAVFSAIVISIAIFIIYRLVMYIVYTFEIIFLTNKIKTKISAQIVDMYIKKGDSTLVDAGDGILVPVESPNKYCVTLRYENYQYTIDNINIYKKFNVGDYIDTYLIKHIYKKSKKLHSYEIKEA